MTSSLHAQKASRMIYLQPLKYIWFYHIDCAVLTCPLSPLLPLSVSSINCNHFYHPQDPHTILYHSNLLFLLFTIFLFINFPCILSSFPSLVVLLMSLYLFSLPSLCTLTLSFVLLDLLSKIMKEHKGMFWTNIYTNRHTWGKVCKHWKCNGKILLLSNSFQWPGWLMHYS